MKSTFLWLLGLLLTVQVMAQNRTITGTVTDAANGEPLIGVSVVGQGTSIGTVTDIDGNYTLSVPKDVSTLEFSYVGYDNVDKPVTTLKINVTMMVTAQELEEFVVSALGLSKSEKTLGYASTQVSGDKLTEVRNNSAIDALSGKIAGVTIATSSGAPGASTKAVIRGYNTLGDGQPLYVIDGVPLNNGFAGEEDEDDIRNNGRLYDFGNQINDIDPDNIESVTVLKGSTATALYGSRGAKGVILITTKKGSSKDKLHVDFSTSYQAMMAGRLVHAQQEFGQGWNSDYLLHENGSWGPKFDFGGGKPMLWGWEVDGSQLLKPFVPLENNIRDFYETGNLINQSIGIGGGTENANYRFSYSFASGDGIIPTADDSYKRHTIGLNGGVKVGKFTISTSINFVNRTQSGVATGQGDDAGKGKTLIQEIIQTPVDISVVDYMDYNNPFFNKDNFYTPFFQNPYLLLAESGNKFTENRVYGNIDVGVEVCKDLNLKWRVGGDFASTSTLDWGNQILITPGSYNGGGGYSTMSDVVGAYSEVYGNSRQLNSDFIISYNKSLFKDAITIDLLAGHNVNGVYSQGLTSYINELIIPGWYNLQNTAGTPVTTNISAQRRTLGLYGSATLGIKDILYLTYNARNDWSSTLPVENNSYFYNGITGSLLISNMFNSKQVPLFKLRGGYATTGNDAPIAITKGGDIISGGIVNFPLNGTPGIEVANTFGNDALQPEFIKEWEIGAEAKLFSSRLSFDYAYYDKKNVKAIILEQLGGSTGGLGVYANPITISNKGHELMVNVIPVKSKKFAWEIGYTFTKNVSKVLEVNSISGNTSIVFKDLYDIELRIEEGKPLGVFYGPVPLTDGEGHTVVNQTNGMPIVDPIKGEYGDMNNKFQMGFENSLSWNGLKFTVGMDYRKGGLMYSYTDRLSYFVGKTTQSTYNDRNPFIVPGSVMDNGDGTFSENTVPVASIDYWSYWTDNANKTSQRTHVIDRTYFKVRDISLSYQLPSKFVSKLRCENLTVSFYGRNLFLWTPSENNFVDPEVTTFGTGLGSEYGEFAGLPTTRNYGFTLKGSF